MIWIMLTSTKSEVMFVPAQAVVVAGVLGRMAYHIQKLEKR
jgi:hypothetical protein